MPDTDALGEKSKQAIVNGDFINRVLDADFTSENLAKHYKFTSSIKAVTPNQHVQDANDTIVQLFYDTDTFEFYRGVENTFLLKAVIAREELVIDSSIKTGVGKDIFKEKFATRIVPDTFLVQDLEAGSVFTFLFDQNKLVRIIYEAPYFD